MTKIIAFPVEIARLAALRQAYLKECERYDAAERACRTPRFNKRIFREYYAARRAVAELNVAIAIPLVAGAEPRVELGEKIADFPGDLALDE